MRTAREVQICVCIFFCFLLFLLGWTTRRVRFQGGRTHVEILSTHSREKRRIAKLLGKDKRDSEKPPIDSKGDGASLRPVTATIKETPHDVSLTKGHTVVFEAPEEKKKKKSVRETGQRETGKEDAASGCHAAKKATRQVEGFSPG